MNIQLTGIGKKYGKEWVFRNVNHQFSSGEKWAVKGSNGSGKSTFVKVLSGFTDATEGAASYLDKKYPEIFKNFSFAAPYLDIIEDFTLRELFVFQARFKPFCKSIDSNKLTDLFNLPVSAAEKRIKDFSSGMKQRVQLGLAILSDVPVTILDEPVSNLDEKGIDWYHNLIEEFTQDRLVLVCSNSIDTEYSFCNHSFNIEDFK